MYQGAATTPNNNSCGTKVLKKVTRQIIWYSIFS